MNLFLFGAGASHGSDIVDTPPLGTNLFNALKRPDPNGWGKMPQPIGDIFIKDFEVGMKRLSDKYPHSS